MPGWRVEFALLILADKADGLTSLLSGDLTPLNMLFSAANPLLLVLLLARVRVLLGGVLLHLLLLLLLL